MYGIYKYLKIITEEMTALQISVSYINDNGGMWLPFNTQQLNKSGGSC